MRSAPGHPAVMLAAGKLGFHFRGAYPSQGFATTGDEHARQSTVGTTKVEAMASSKKTDDENDRLLMGDPALRAVEPEVERVDDVPDRLLILANRLQRALDSRRAATAHSARTEVDRKIEDER
ncbi:hypothetical protein ASE60_32840 [Ensifer sp. Root278]|nr:hypothetical protein ASE60_32840 [Ensifer sp. Root278]